MHPSKGSEDISKDAVEKRLKTSIPNFAEMYDILWETEDRFNQKKVRCFICKFKTEQYAKAFLKNNFDNFCVKPILCLNY